MINGFDTSAWQYSKVDYYKAKQSGMKFVFLRVGCGKTKDKCFENDYAAARACGLKVGVYYYTYSTTVPEAIQDATRVLGWLNDRKLDFPIAYDVEDAKQKKNSKDTNSAMYNAFRDKIEELGVYDAILYSGEYYFNNYFNRTSITDDLWIARYSSTQPNVGREIAVWQFTSGAIDTVYYKGKLDRNYMLTDTFKGSRKNTTPTKYNPYPEPCRLLKKTVPCMRGNDVKWLQWELGFNGSDVDGIFGNQTLAKVKEYQTKHGLKVDGIVGSATRYAMKND